MFTSLPLNGCSDGDNFNPQCPLNTLSPRFNDSYLSGSLPPDMEDALKSLSGELFDDLSMKQRIFETEERSLRETELSEPNHQSETKLRRPYFIDSKHSDGSKRYKIRNQQTKANKTEGSIGKGSLKGSFKDTRQFYMEEVIEDQELPLHRVASRQLNTDRPSYASQPTDLIRIVEKTESSSEYEHDYQYNPGEVANP